MTYKEIKNYLYSGNIIRNDEYEYKISKKCLYTRNIGCLVWNFIESIPDNEEKQEWEIVC